MTSLLGRIDESDPFNVGVVLKPTLPNPHWCGRGATGRWFPKLVDSCKYKNRCCRPCNDESNLKPLAEVEPCQAKLRVIRPRLALVNVYKPGDFVTAEEIVHAKACHTPKLDSMYGTPVWKDLKERDLV